MVTPPSHEVAGGRSLCSPQVACVAPHALVGGLGRGIARQAHVGGGKRCSWLPPHGRFSSGARNRKKLLQRENAATPGRRRAGVPWSPRPAGQPNRRGRAMRPTGSGTPSLGLQYCSRLVRRPSRLCTACVHMPGCGPLWVCKKWRYVNRKRTHAMPIHTCDTEVRSALELDVSGYLF